MPRTHAHFRSMKFNVKINIVSLDVCDAIVREWCDFVGCIVVQYVFLASKEVTRYSGNICYVCVCVLIDKTCKHF